MDLKTDNIEVIVIMNNPNDEPPKTRLFNFLNEAVMTLEEVENVVQENEDAMEEIKEAAKKLKEMIGFLTENRDEIERIIISERQNSKPSTQKPQKGPAVLSLIKS